MKADISPLLGPDTLLFTGYDDDYIRINDDRHGTGLCLHAGRITAPWGPQRVRELSIEHLEAIVADPPEVLLIGTGRLTAFPSAEIMDYLADHHIGFECMDSRAAARTYNILVGEGRRVSIVMLLPGARR